MTEFRIIFEKPVLKIGYDEYQYDGRCRAIMDRFNEQFGYSPHEVEEARFSEGAVELDVVPLSDSLCRWCDKPHRSYQMHTVRHDLQSGAVSVDGVV